ncbi:hypothetical protein L345_11564, partial [Ophiophagus hannah]
MILVVPEVQKVGDPCFGPFWRVPNVIAPNFMNFFVVGIDQTPRSLNQRGSGPSFINATLHAHMHMHELTHHFRGHRTGIGDLFIKLPVFPTCTFFCQKLEINARNSKSHQKVKVNPASGTVSKTRTLNLSSFKAAVLLIRFSCPTQSHCLGAAMSLQLLCVDKGRSLSPSLGCCSNWASSSPRPPMSKSPPIEGGRDKGSVKPALSFVPLLLISPKPVLQQLPIAVSRGFLISSEGFPIGEKPRHFQTAGTSGGPSERLRSPQEKARQRFYSPTPRARLGLPGPIKGQPGCGGYQPAKMVLTEEDKARVRACWAPVSKNAELYGAETLTR